MSIFRGLYPPICDGRAGGASNQISIRLVFLAFLEE